MKSIQTRLTIRLIAGVLAISILGSLAVYLVFRSAILRQFDNSLRAEAHSIASLYQRDHDGSYEFLGPANAMFGHHGRVESFCIRRMDGTVVLKSASLGNRRCPGLDHATNDHGIRRGLFWRGILYQFVPASEGRYPGEPHQLILVFPSGELDELLSHLMKALIAVALFASAAVFLLVTWTVRRDLAPLRKLAHEAGAIGAGDLAKRFSCEGVPRELDPIHRALNGLLQRMEVALKREKRFTADVAHELRTPVAELRSLCEVANAAGGAAATEALADAEAIAVQMETLITQLLALRRGEERASLATVDVVAAAREAWGPATEQAASHGLSMIWHLPDRAEFPSDKTMLVAVLRNLIENAVCYTKEGGEIECLLSGGALVVRNRPHGLKVEDIAHLSEPFWRKDAARSGGIHCGLGLALCEAYAHAFGGELRHSLDGEGWFSARIVFARR